MAARSVIKIHSGYVIQSAAYHKYQFLWGSTMTATNHDGDKPRRRQTTTATNHDGHKPRRPQTTTATNNDHECYTWNVIPLNIRNSPSVSSFKRHLKTLFFHRFLTSALCHQRLPAPPILSIHKLSVRVCMATNMFSERWYDREFAVNLAIS